MKSDPQDTVDLFWGTDRISAYTGCPTADLRALVRQPSVFLFVFVLVLSLSHSSVYLVWCPVTVQRVQHGFTHA
jgi:hypothetical protein